MISWPLFSASHFFVRFILRKTVPRTMKRISPNLAEISLFTLWFAVFSVCACVDLSVGALHTAVGTVLCCGVKTRGTNFTLLSFGVEFCDCEKAKRV